MRPRFLRTFTGLLFVAVAMLWFLLSGSAVMAETQPQLTANIRLEHYGPQREVVLADLPDLSPAEIAGFKEEPEPRNPHFTEAAYHAAKEAASHDPVGTRPGDAANLLIPRPHGPIEDTPSNYIDFFAQSQGCNGSGWYPSDMGLAVNPSYVVQVVNECIAVYAHNTGALLKATDICTFVGLPPNSGTHGCFDVRAAYDYVSNRFLVTVDYQDSSGNAFIFVCASVTSDPRGSWLITTLSRGVGLADFPTLGKTWGDYSSNPHNSVITVCDNFFGSSGFAYAECMLLATRCIENTSCPSPENSYYSVNSFSLGGILLDTIQPTNDWGPNEKPRAQFAINSFNYNGSDGLCSGGVDQGVVVWSFSNSVNFTGSPGPAISGFWTGCGSTSTYSFPGYADNANFCSSCIDTDDSRITGIVHYFAGLLYPTINTNNGGRSAVLGWKVHPYLNDNGDGHCTGAYLNLCPTLSDVKIEQEFCYDCGGGTSAEAYYGAIVMDQENNWTMYAAFSSTSLSPGEFYTSNRVSWETPFHDSGIFACQNNAAYSYGRWGDYSAGAPDIYGKFGDQPAMWGSGDYVQPSNTWGTCISSNRYVADSD